MMEEKDLIRIRWHVDRTQEPAMYMLVCLHPDYPDLQVSISSEEVTERVAKAKLMEEQFYCHPRFMYVYTHGGRESEPAVNDTTEGEMDDAGDYDCHGRCSRSSACRRDDRHERRDEPSITIRRKQKT